MKKKYLLKSAINTARISRLIAKAIDLFIVGILAIMFYPFGLIVSLFYMCFSDSLHNGQSVGKRIIGFSVISLEDGTPCSTKQSVLRNLPIIVPLAFCIIPLWGWIFGSIILVTCVTIEIFFLFKLDSCHRWGDVFADTTVIGNDPNRVDIRENKESWFGTSEKNMSPCNRSVL